jgi:hypothetical protein
MAPPVMTERTDYAALREHLKAGEPWLDPMAWQLVLDAEAEAIALRKGIQRVLDLRSSYDGDRGRGERLVNNLQAREMLEELLS